MISRIWLSPWRMTCFKSMWLLLLLSDLKSQRNCRRRTQNIGRKLATSCTTSTEVFVCPVLFIFCFLMHVFHFVITRFWIALLPDLSTGHFWQRLKLNFFTSPTDLNSSPSAVCYVYLRLCLQLTETRLNTCVWVLAVIQHQRTGVKEAVPLPLVVM